MRWTTGVCAASGRFARTSRGHVRVELEQQQRDRLRMLVGDQLDDHARVEPARQLERRRRAARFGRSDPPHQVVGLELADRAGHDPTDVVRAVLRGQPGLVGALGEAGDRVGDRLGPISPSSHIFAPIRLQLLGREPRKQAGGVFFGQQHHQHGRALRVGSCRHHWTCSRGLRRSPSMRREGQQRVVGLLADDAPGELDLLGELLALGAVVARGVASEPAGAGQRFALVIILFVVFAALLAGDGPEHRPYTEQEHQQQRRAARRHCAGSSRTTASPTSALPRPRSIRTGARSP
jgi:hypothetical protein